MKFFIATKNTHKIKEFSAIFSSLSIQLLSEKDLESPLEDVEEGGATFGENALIKARYAASVTGLPTLADDSGLCVDVLDGEPGIYSARYAGVHGNDTANNQKLLKKLTNETNRKAKFVCAIACVFPDGREFTVMGECTGRIDTEIRGNSGFGYDPIFISDEKGSFGIISAEEKNRVSHRAKAVKKFKEEIIKYI